MILEAWRSVLASLTLAAAAAPAIAAPIVVAGSTYDAIVYGVASGYSEYASLSFDGVASTLTNGGRTVSINDGQQELGGGNHRISFVFESMIEMFSVPGEWGSFNIGAKVNPVDLASPVDLLSVVMRAFDGDGVQIADLNYSNPAKSPWNGFWPDVYVVAAFFDIGGRDLRRVEMDLNVAEIPAPSSLLLAFAALVALGGASRSRSRT